MAPWKALPASLDPHGRHLVAQLRALKDRSGLSLSAIERRTTYSRSSWERYLNGKKFPPADAVKELAQIAQGDVPRLLAMHSLAEEAWARRRETATQAPSGGGTAAGGTAGTVAEVAGNEGNDVENVSEVALAGGELESNGEPSGEDHPSDAVAAGDGGAHEAPGERPLGRPTRPRWARTPTQRRPRERLPFPQALTITALTAALTAAGIVTALRLLEPSDTGTRSAGSDQEFTLEPGRTHGCTLHRRDGRLYAGHSRTTDTVLFQIKTGWEVVEAQCLLDHRGYSVGDIDGAYDARTARAVKRFQEDAPELAVDGLVGPHTWEVLRR
ncbi:peptidoglycan-binding protein [Streptomyces triticagri]|uniref:Peptidoglycan-binding protein n=1 Tax=Streptomyces triticagri TaxID=2293568 RepID=A0A372LYQ8_9ACTN|nr:peptidoglycan-binding protein [Streptomyces triticagri]RFU83771.1 peptidoglycan-binding protein [Streptomyces triticagri]